MKDFDLCLINLQKEYNNFIENFGKTTIQILYDIGRFDSPENKDEVFKEYSIVNAKQRGELESDKY